jgi:hypothetical protein
MGFLDKVKGAVSTAKEELDKSGLLDQLKGGDGPGMSSSSSTSSSTTGERDTTQDMIDSIRRGAVDPRLLISRSEIGAIVGHDVGDPELGFNGDFVSAMFEGNRERYALHCFHNMDDDRPWNADEQWDFLREHGDDDDVEIPGLGDAAYRQGAYVFAKAHGRVLYAEAYGDKLPADAAAFRSEAIMRAAVNRLGQLQ